MPLSPRARQLPDHN